MVCHILDISLLQEWLNTCGEYLKNVQRPFAKMSFVDMWKCNHSSLDDWFTTWSVVQFFYAVIVHCVVAAIFAVDGKIGAGAYLLVVGVLAAWLWAHIGWFSVVKKDGCCCLCLICMSKAPILLLIFGVWLMVWAVAGIVNSLQYLSYKLGFIITISYATYAIPLLYMGMIMVKMWLRKQNEPQLGDTSAVVIGKSAS